METPPAKSDRWSSSPIYFAMLAPVFGLAVLAAMVIADAAGQHGKSVVLAEKIALSTEASNLAHELQKERGMSAGHVGSKGAQFGPQLKKQRALTDAVLAEVAAAVTAQEGGDGPVAARLNDRAAALTKAFATLGQIRGEIDALSITVPELAKFYTGTIRRLLSLPDDPLIGGQLDDVARRNTVYKDILMAKEFAGVERAAGSVGFGRGGFDDKTFAWYNGLQQRQLYLFDRIRELGDASERALLSAALESEATQRVLELRALAAESLQTQDVNGVTGPDWFKASTAYLGELRKLERAVAVSIQTAAASRAEQAWTWAAGLGAVVLLFIIGFGAFGYRYVHSMIAALRGLRDAISRIERAEDDIAIPSMQRRDAIGDIARSLDTISSQGADAARVRAAVAASDTPLLIVDAKGAAVFENAAFTGLVENRAADLSALELSAETTGKRDASRFLEEIQTAKSLGRIVKKSRGEEAVELVVGASILEARPSPVLDAAGNEIGSTLQVSDVTEVRKLEIDVIDVIESVKRGEFRKRVRYVDELGFTSVAANGLNRQMDGIQSFMDALDASLSSMAGGDLTHTMAEQFEGDFARAKDSVNTNLTALVAMVSAVSGAAVQVQQASGPIADGANNLAQRAEEQAAALEEVNATMEEMSRTISRSAEQAQSAASLAATASERAAAGHSVLDETRGAMRKIEDSSSKVVEIISVIDSIAFQTNLLALNAAVEAARAGDAGKGFAVVASEVRTLAQRSSDAASEIRGLIDESSGNVTEGVQLMERTKGALEEINGSIETLNSMIGDIARAGEAQAQSAKEISTTTTHLDSLTQANASVALESARSADNLRSQADQLMAQVARFKTDGAEGVEAAA